MKKLISQMKLEKVSIENCIDEREVYSGYNHPIFSLAVVYQCGWRFFNELWAVFEDEKGALYASVEMGEDGFGEYEDRFYFDMKNVHREDEIEIGLYKETANPLFCERFYKDPIAAEKASATPIATW